MIRNRIPVLFGGASWTPNKLSGLQLWLKADSITGIANLGTIAQWNDLSGNGNHCTQATEGNKPIYSASGVNGKPEVAFSYIDLGVGDVRRKMTIPNGVSVNENNCTLIYVGRPISKALQAGYVVPVAIAELKLGWSPLYGAIVIGGALLESNNARVYHQPQMVGLTSNAVAVKYWYNDVSQSFAAVGSAVKTGGSLGMDPGDNYPIYGTLSEVLIYNRALTDAEMDQVYSYVKKKYAMPTPTKQVIFDGDSLTTGYACLNHANFPGQTWGLLGSDWKIYSVAVAGQTLANMQSDAAAEIDPLYDAGLSKNVLVCWEGLLDVYGGADVATTLTRMETYCAARQAAGWQVVVLTCLPSLYISEANRGALNTGIRNNYGDWADALADIAADSRIGDAGDNDDATYYNNSDTNKTHMTQAGFAIVASIVKAAIDGLP